MTDIGNDLLYGATPDRLLGWVEGCLDRLAEAGAATTVTHLPAGSVETLSERRFHFFRRLLFSRSTLTLAEAKELIREINQRLTALGDARNLSVISVSANWYGLDPIHIKRRAERQAWPALLAGWREEANEFALCAILYFFDRVFGFTGAVRTFAIRNCTAYRTTVRSIF